ncbi:MAG: hypothetical protein NC319_01000 [Butyricicoccus sp.]|nr:hypothetical protein [Butyricicoccus sp.]
MTKSGVSSKKLTPKRVALSSAFACALMAALLLAISALISRELLPLSYARAYACVSMFSGAALGAVLLASGVSEGKAFAALINAGMLVALVLIVGLIAGQGSVSASAIPYQLMCIALGSITGCIPTLRVTKYKRK